MNEWLLFQYSSFDKLKTSLRESDIVCKGLFRVTIKVRERVQISASGHTDADQLGTDFFRFRWRSDPILSAPNETESATGLKSLSGQLTKVIKNIWQLK